MHIRITLRFSDDCFGFNGNLVDRHRECPPDKARREKLNECSGHVIL